MLETENDIIKALPFPYKHNINKNIRYQITTAVEVASVSNWRTN
jgi:hypothetical protein